VKTPKWHSLLFKVCFLLGLILLSNHLHALPAGILNYHDSDGYSTPQMAAPAIIPGISPIFDLYAYWDTTNVDPYKFNFDSIAGALQLQVLEADCGFALPVIGTMTSPFGWRWGQVHAGIDISLRTGDTIVSAFDGVVRMSRWYHGYGNCVVVRHHNGLETLYGHLSQRLVNPGDLVNAGQIIGLGGSTGYSTGPHLHFETRILGKPFNPESLIDFKKDSLLQDTMSFTTSSFALPTSPVYRSYYRRGYRGYYKKSYRRGSGYRRRR
jgi:murein DD-endopeptidase MepM/ murein hydrolase activator NlpD